MLLSAELPEPDGAPVRITVLGEDLRAFRATDGSVGLVSPRCPHRGADLFFGRNEEGGIRCAYHGWKFATDGRCLAHADAWSPDPRANAPSKTSAFWPIRRARPAVSSGLISARASTCRQCRNSSS